MVFNDFEGRGSVSELAGDVDLHRVEHGLLPCPQDELLELVVVVEEI